MYFASPWGLIGLVALPAILYIHLYRRRFPPRQIAGLFLWLSPRQQTPSGTQRERIPITLSLILELLAALLVTLLLSDPRIRSTEQYRHLVFVLDNSASMTARDADGESSAERARRFVQRQLGVAPNTKVALLLTGRRPVILGRTEEDPGAASPWLDSYRPSLPSHSPAGALDLALEVAGANGEVFFVSDRLPADDEREKRVTYIALGKPAGNVGFVWAEWTPRLGPSKGKIFLRLANFSSKGKKVQLTARVEGQTVLHKELDVAPGAEEKIVWSAPGGAEVVSFDLPADSLDIDNHLVLVSPPRKVVGVASLLPEGKARKSVLRALGVLDGVKLVAPDRAHLLIAPPERFNLSREGSWWLVAGPLSEDYRAPGDPKNVVGPFLMERTHPLLDGVTLEGVIFPGAAPAKKGLTPIVSCGDLPLIAILQSTLARVYWLNLDLGRSNLCHSPDWPILCHNLVGLRRGALPGFARRSFRLGEEIRYARPDPARALTVTGPEGYTKEFPPAPELYLSRLSAPGVYRIESDGELADRFSVNLLDDRESKLTSLTDGRLAGERPPALLELALAQRPGWAAFLLGGLVVVAILWNWWLSSRRQEGD